MLQAIHPTFSEEREALVEKNRIERLGGWCSTPWQDVSGAFRLTVQTTDTYKPLTGRQLCKLMRLHGCTIRDLKERTGFTIKRIREVRENGLTNHEAGRDWIQAVTGSDPGSDWEITDGKLTGAAI